ncbi:MAG TPA: 7-cyano-7-deazaguanine synthase [Verrucomicrobiota bacterium]|nr:7-cyano-7-deazaguanine synthase [Verrucomicrobiota bacterium]
MDNLFIIPCGGQSPVKGGLDGAVVLPLNLWTPQKSRPDYLRLELEDLHGKLFKPVPKQFEDLLEIATYVYCADQATSRGGLDVDTFGGRWRRRFQFHIPVREPDLWNSAEMQKALADTLGFLSDDVFEFTFTAAKHAPGMQHYLPGLKDDNFRGEPQQVVMFSGGLDSLSGAVEEAVRCKRRLMLVNHRPTDKLNNVHRRLEALLAEKAGNFAPTHLHVHINKNSHLNKNYTQRTRSFLYVAIGATVAQMLGQRNVRFYENGVVSLNLPVCAQVLGSRATRTTHPRVLQDYGNVLGLVAGEKFTVENPFIWETKGEIVERIVKADCAELIGHSVSCAHTFSFSNDHPHCGTCSQCIDRRFGVIAAGAEAFDPAAGYATDIFTGARPQEEDRMMMALYLERAKRVANIKGAAEIITLFPEVVRTLKFLGGSPLAAAEQVVALHKRHGAEVKRVLEEMLKRYSAKIVDRSIPKDCLLRIVYDSGPAEMRPEPAKKIQRAQETPLAEKQDERWEREELSKDTFRLAYGHKAWSLVFAGKRDVLIDERAVKLIEHLLKNPPDEPIHATELEKCVDGHPVLDGVGRIGQAEDFGHVPVALGSVGGVIEEASGRKLAGKNTLPALRAKVVELKAASEDELLPEEEREEARQELASLLKAQSRGGKFADAASRSAERVRKQIKTFIKEMKTAKGSRGQPNMVLQAFGKHLEDHLWLPSVGAKNRIGAAGRPGCFTYEPPKGVHWRD